jgi:epoxyqueuosine reductase
MLLSETEQKRFLDNPAQFIEQAIKHYTAHSVNNRFPAFPEDLIWDEPLVGFASGDDPIFLEYKKIIGDFHFTPRDVIESYIDATGYGDKARLPHISVISFIFPATEKTRLSNRQVEPVCSLRWNHTRFHGQEFIARLSRYLVTLIEEMGNIAVAPELSKQYETVNTSKGMSSKWSQRHAAYAAGLGTFSLNDGFITSKGIAVRAGSVVCNLELPASPRKYADHYSNCLFYARKTCRKCAERCPAGAISDQGHDKIKCQAYLNSMRETAARLGKIESYVGKAYLGCGFCQTGVPCEDRIPLQQTT